MRSTSETDIFISGGGVAGLTAAAAFGHLGWQVVLADPVPPVTDGVDPGADLRTTAFLQPSKQLLGDAGIWDRLAPFAAPLSIMRIVDAGGEKPEPRLVKTFAAEEISDEPFGWNLPNWLIRREILGRLADLPNVRFLPGVGTASVLTRMAHAQVTLSDGSALRAKLVIGADGRDSKVRNAAGIAVKTIRYGQKALVFTVTHPLPHDNISTEIHRTGGPFTLVPLPPTDQGRHRSAVVWMERTAEAERLAELPPEEFDAAATARSCRILGPLTLAGRRSAWPIISQLADRMSGERVALMAEAAHVLPPIGAQGLNMSLADLQCLLTLTAHKDPGDAAVLDAYHHARHFDVKLRFAGIDALNRASMAQGPVLRDLRAGALNALYSFGPLRKGLMKLGLGLR